MSCSLNTFLILLIMASTNSCTCSKADKKGGGNSKFNNSNNPIKYHLEIEGLGADNLVAASNKFTLQIRKEGGKIDSGETKNFKVLVTAAAGNASIIGLNADTTISFLAGENIDGIIRKEVTVLPGTVESEFILDLKYNQAKVADTGKTIKIKPPASSVLGLVVDKPSIQDGTTDIILNVKQLGIGELTEADLSKLSLRIQRETGESATIGGISTGNLILHQGNNKLIIAADKKSATKKLTISPGKDNKATFKLILLHSIDKVIPNTEQTIQWNNGIEVQVDKLVYNSANGRIEYKLHNNGLAATASVELQWKRERGNMVTIDGKQQASRTINLINKQEIIGFLPVEWGADLYANFEIIVMHNGVGKYKQLLPLAKTAPKIKMVLADPAESFLQGNAQKKVKLRFTVASQLVKEDLQSITLDYASTHGALVTSLRGEYVRGKNLYDLLGNSLLTEGAIADLELTIDNDNKSQVTFKDIKLLGSENEDANKIPQIQWKGEIKVGIAGRENLLQLRGDSGKIIPLQFINESGFALERSNLEEIKIEVYNLPIGASVNYANRIIQSKQTSLWDVLGTGLGAGQIIEKEFNIVPGTNPSLGFNILLVGDNNLSVNNKVDVLWKGSMNIKIEGTADLTKLRGVTGTTVPIRFINESGFDLEEMDLRKAILNLAITNGATLVYDNSKNVQNGRTTLWDILGDKVPAGESIEKNLIIQPGRNSLVDLDLALGGENLAAAEEKHVVVNWNLAEIKVQIQGHNGLSPVDLTKLVGNGGKQFHIRFMNKSDFSLEKEDLKNLVIELVGLPNGVSLKLGREDIVSGKTTLFDINPRVFEKGSTFDRTFTMQTGTLTVADFGFKLAGENKERDHNLAISWAEGYNESEVKILDVNRKATVYRDKGKFKCKLEFTNEGSTNLNAGNLKNIKLEVGGKDQPKELIFNKNKKLESGVTALGDLFSDLKAGATKEVKFTVNPGMAPTLDFTIGLINTSSLDTKRVIIWNRKVEMTFTKPFPQPGKDNSATFKGTKNYLLKLTNDADDVTSDDLIIKVIADKGAKFKLGDQFVGEEGTRLTNVIKQKQKQAIIISTKQTVKIIIAADESSIATRSDIKLVVEYAHTHKKAAVRHLKWEK